MNDIACFIDPNDFNLLQAQNIRRSSKNTIQHRRPDDEGIWIEKYYGIVLAHQRLVIIDLTQSGYFKSPDIQKKLKQHISCEKDWQHFLWKIFFFETWYKGNAL